MEIGSFCARLAQREKSRMLTINHSADDCSKRFFEQAQLFKNAARFQYAPSPYMSKPYDPFGSEPQNQELGTSGKAFYGIA